MTAPLTAEVGERSRDLLRALAETYAARRPVRTVAVLGNQPLDPSEERVALVEAADLVVRVNGFAVDAPGAPPTYGRAAHVVVFNRALRATPAFFDGYRERLYLMVEPARPFFEREEVPSWWPADLGQVHLNNDSVVLPLSDALGLDMMRDGLWATTGTVAAWWARTHFPDARLRLGGYSFLEDDTQTHWQHAAGDACIVGQEHRIAAEARLLRSWLDDGSAELLP